MTSKEFLENFYLSSDNYKKSNHMEDFDNLYDLILDNMGYASEIDYDLISDVLNELDFKRIDNTLIFLGLLTATFKYSEKIPTSYYPFYHRFKHFMLNDKKISLKKFNDGYKKFEKGAGNYWKDMDMLGAPEWISGKKSL